MEAKRRAQKQIVLMGVLSVSMLLMAIVLFVLRSWLWGIYSLINGAIFLYLAITIYRFLIRAR